MTRNLYGVLKAPSRVYSLLSLMLDGGYNYDPTQMAVAFVEKGELPKEVFNTGNFGKGSQEELKRCLAEFYYFKFPKRTKEG